MAESLKANGKDDGPTKGHNVADVNKLIRDCASSFLDIKKQRKELNEEAADIRERLRESGVQTKAFDFAVRVMEMEAEAQAEYLDNLRVNFEALGIGAQSEMFAAAEGAGEEARSR